MLNQAQATMTATVYHSTVDFGKPENLSAYLKMTDAIESGQQLVISSSQLIPIAEVKDCTLLHDAYLKTQLSSLKDTEVNLLTDSLQRSTSIGDVIEQGENFYLVSTAGFYPVTVSA